jgi:putative transposase
MDLRILEFNGEADHVHALIEYPPNLSISQIVNSLKGVSSRMYGKAGFEKQKWMHMHYGVLETSVSSVGGAPIEVLKKYIQNQEKPS